jgi:hypothetical protein
MDHEPRRCSQEDAEDLPADNHSGSRLVLLLLMIPLSVFGGWIGYSIAREMGRTLLDPITAQRLAYVIGGVAILLVVLVVVRWQTALSPRAQAEADDQIDAMDDNHHTDHDD